MASALQRDLPRFRLTLPNRMFDDHLVLAGAGRCAEVLTYGCGHTESDAFVHLAADRVVLAGDLLWVGRHPCMASGDPLSWAGILERMAVLGATVLVPGHGEVGDPGHLPVLASYLREVSRLVEEAAAAGLDAAALADVGPPPGSGS